MKQFDMHKYFDAIVDSHSTTAHKPDAEVCNAALKILNVKPEESLMIGDSKYDIICGHNAGVKAVAVNWSICYPESERVGLAKPDYEINTATELLEVLNSLR